MQSFRTKSALDGIWVSEEWLDDDRVNLQTHQAFPSDNHKNQGKSMTALKENNDTLGGIGICKQSTLKPSRLAFNTEQYLPESHG